MSLELHRPPGGGLTVSEAEWTFILLFAEQYGWAPVGTLAPRTLNPRVSWDGQYDVDAGQEVTAEDALAMARALQYALRDPYRQEIEGAVARHLAKALAQITGMPSQLEFPDLTAEMTAIMELCQGGAFVIGTRYGDE